MTFGQWWEDYVGCDRDKSLDTGRIYAKRAWNQQQKRIAGLEALVDDYAQYQVCNCCGALSNDLVDAGGHMQCKSCTRIAELEARELGYIQSLRELEAENQRYKEAMEPLEGRSPLAAMKYIDHLEQTTKRLRGVIKFWYDEGYNRLQAKKLLEGEHENNP